MLRWILGLVTGIFGGVTQIRKELKKLMAQIDDLTAAVGAVAADVRRISDDVRLVIARLGQPGVDLQGQIDALKSVDTDLQSAATTMESAVNPPTPPAP